MSTWKTFKTIRDRYGIKGFYRGFLPTLIMGLNGTLTVCTNDLLKSSVPETYETFWGNFLLGGSARVISSSILYPFNTIRTRLMQN
jgi:hypothetical protein